MKQEDNIIVPRWFLENVENTLRIQNNINLDKETGETCQDRNVRQSLNGLRKLLKGEELTGRERLEKLQPSLPSNVDEAAEEYADYNCKRWQEDGDIYYDHGKLIDAFKAGAQWRDAQIPKLPEGLDEAAFDKLFDDFCNQHPDGLTLEECGKFFYAKGKEAGAKWMAGQEKFDCPDIPIKDAIEVTSRMKYIKPEFLPIAKFFLDYAYYDLHKDEWNQPVVVVPVFRVLDAIAQEGKPYCGG